MIILKWNPSNHRIADIRDWDSSNTLELTPDFQRKEVWSKAAQIMLMDSILKNIPMPKIIVHSLIKDQRGYRQVIDGQQRIKAILAFLKDGFALTKPYEGPYLGYKYSMLPSEVQNDFLGYLIDFNELRNASEEETRDIYSRLNKYNVPLNKQELRKADFPGDFLELAESLSQLSFFDESRIFTAANSKRMGDVEFISEVLAALIEGPQDKKDRLDDFYINYSVWEKTARENVETEFDNVIKDYGSIFNGGYKLSESRFRQKADFYSMFLAILELRREGCILDNKDLTFLRRDLQILDDFIAPSSDIEIFSEYAVMCVSQANSHSSRTWRKDFLKNILRGTYSGVAPQRDVQEIFKNIIFDVNNIVENEQKCATCQSTIRYSDEEFENTNLYWSQSTLYYQISNAELQHKNC